MAKRLATEREFHNNRFKGGDNRHAQLKYYWAVARGAELYSLKVFEFSKNADALEYGCGAEPHGAKLINIAKSICAIDISDEAIKSASQAHRAPNLTLRVMDAMHMDFSDSSFDLVFGSGIVHHLDTMASACEISRVLRKNGKAIFWEPLGLNPLINVYRYFTPSARTPDEHPLRPHDIKIFRDHFYSVDLRFFGLTTLAAVPFRSSGAGGRTRRTLERVDDAILAIPGLRYLAWYCLIQCTR